MQQAPQPHEQVCHQICGAELCLGTRSVPLSCHDCQQCLPDRFSGVISDWSNHPFNNQPQLLQLQKEERQSKEIEEGIGRLLDAGPVVGCCTTSTVEGNQSRLPVDRLHVHRRWQWMGRVDKGMTQGTGFQLSADECSVHSPGAFKFAAAIMHRIQQ
jgi:hypothetical protein